MVGVAHGASTPVPGEGSTTTASTPDTTSTAAETPPAQTTSTNTTTTTPPATTPPPSSTAPQPATPAPAVVEAPTVVLQRKQKATPGTQPRPNASATAPEASTGKSSNAAKAKKPTGPNNVAAAPQSVAQAGALAAILASSQASTAALDFYRIPLFLLPIYKAAAVQYGVPWQILAAINEIETDYGTDLSVSTAGAVGWMQFMPSTWLQYGVDALDAGYADPYNPVDAIFAAARYLRAAGAQTNLREAILAYNHSEEYANSVLLRAKLIATYPKAVIATLTGLIDGRLPVSGKQIAWSALAGELTSPSSATANATAVTGEGSSASAAAASASSANSPASTPGSSAAPSPATAAAAATPHSAASGQTFGLVDVTSAPNASVVAVQDGRIVKLGHSRALGKYVILRDIYGDLFTYAGLGSIAPTYSLPKDTSRATDSPVVEVASTRAPTPSQPASAGVQSPLTLSVKAPQPKALPASAEKVTLPSGAAEEEAPIDAGKVRLFAHPDNPDARAAAAIDAAIKARNSSAGQRQPLRRGSVVASGTVLGRVSVPVGDKDGHLRFSIRPAGDSTAIDPGPILANWAQLQTALHPQGAKATDALLGATASDVFLLSKEQLERSVLSDPGITIYACGRHDIASGFVDKRVLAVLAFLSRSGLKPTVSALRCGQARDTVTGVPSAQYEGDAVDISAINGVAIGGHQGTGTITDLTIRALMTLPTQFVPHEIVSLMRYPGAPNTHANPEYWNQIHLVFRPATPAAPATAVEPTKAAHSASTGAVAAAPVVTTTVLSPVEWGQLITRVATIPEPSIPRKPSSQAIPDPKKRG
jgi:membrane-bound lytic murein transglycosylase B